MILYDNIMLRYDIIIERYCELTCFAGLDVGDAAGQSSSDVVDGNDPQLVGRVGTETSHHVFGVPHVSQLVVRRARRVLAPVLHDVRLYGARRVVRSWFPVETS